MRVGIATVYTPGILGGAEYHAAGLGEALRRAGHSLHMIRLPFRFDPPQAVAESIRLSRAVDMRPYGGGQIDALIGLKFPAYMIRHPRSVTWLLHQHRPAYDLYDTRFGWRRADRATDALREDISRLDKEALGGERPIFTNSRRVSERLRVFNGIKADPLYHPPPDEMLLHCAEAEPYIFAPSRLEELKRQDLLLRAVAIAGGRIQVVFTGSGGRRSYLENLAGELGITDRVRFLGEVSRAEMIALYARSAGVFFGPLDEDYGYVTLEAMLSGKPVVTCTDSGGPLEFVRDGETGWVVQPTPEAVASVISRLMAEQSRSARMGLAGQALYRSMNIGWDKAVATLLTAATASEKAVA